ncbi:MAG: sodium/proton-translocating pyrophosphatase, partial [Bacteroidia bacterium]|nr:sodium/proton-translocating pyrophosphatase [Bacteroidia bacterium]
VSGVLLGIFQNNAGGAWDNAKKSFEKGVMINGEMSYKKSEPHKASVTGDTVGDPFKDTSGPSMNILIKLMSIVSLVIAPYIAIQTNGDEDKKVVTEELIKTNISDSIANAGKKDLSELKGMFDVDGAHSSVGFSVVHIITNTSGSILIDSGYVNFDSSAATKIFMQFDVKTINTQNSTRDEHLRDKPQFFEVAKFPKITFSASEISKNPEAGAEYTYVAKGNLTLKGIIKPVELKFNYMGTQTMDGRDGGPKVTIAGFDGKVTFNPKDFNFDWGSEAVISTTIEAGQEGK